MSLRKKDSHSDVGHDRKSKEAKEMLKQLMNAPIGVVLLGLMATVAASGQAQAEKRTFTIAAVEMKGGVTVDKEQFPTEALPAGAGYVLNKPDQTAAGRSQFICGHRARSSSTRTMR